MPNKKELVTMLSAKKLLEGLNYLYFLFYINTKKYSISHHKSGNYFV